MLSEEVEFRPVCFPNRDHKVHISEIHFREPVVLPHKVFHCMHLLHLEMDNGDEFIEAFEVYNESQAPTLF